MCFGKIEVCHLANGDLGYPMDPPLCVVGENSYLSDDATLQNDIL